MERSPEMKVSAIDLTDISHQVLAGLIEPGLAGFLQALALEGQLGAEGEVSSGAPAQQVPCGKIPS